MNDSIAIGKRAVAIAVASMTILWSVGVSALVAPLSASAATPGTLVKGTSLSTVYYYASNGSRYAFPNEKTYLTWFSDFSGVQTISDAELAAIPLTGNIVYRPGSRWIKIQSDPKTYVVTPQGHIRWVESEEVAMGLAGSNWNQMIDDVADVFFVDYTVGASLTSAAGAFNGALVSMSGNTYLVWDGMTRLVTSSGFTANRFQTRNLLDGTGITLAGMTAGADITGGVSSLMDPAQLGETITGGLSVSLASTTPASVTVPGGADSVPFTTFKLMANGGPVTVSTLTVNLGGVGATSNIDNVYLFEGSKRLTDGRSVNSSSRSTTFSGLSIALATGETKYLTIKADTSDGASGGDTANFSISSASSITSTATVSGSFPAMGNSMTFASQTAGTVIVTANGSVTDPTIGQEDALIGKFTLTADGEDTNLKEITLNIDNAVDHSNFKLWKGSTLLAAGTDIGRDLVNFVLTDSFVIQDGSNENLRVTANIGGSNGDSLIVSIDNSVDVVAIGADFGFNSSVDVTAYDDGSSACTQCTRSAIQGGDLTFAFNGPISDNIQIGGQDQTIMKFSITAEQYSNIRSLDVVIDATDLNDGTDPNFEQFTLRRTDGTVWMGPEEISGTGSATQQTLTFTDDQSLNAGETIDLMLTADVSSTADAAADDTIAATLDMSTVDAEDSNGDTVTNLVPTADIVGNTFTLTDSTLTVVVASPPSDGTYVKGTSAVPVVGFSFEASDASDVTVTDITLRAAGDLDGTWDGESDAVESDTISSCSLYDSETGSLAAGPEALNTSSEALFTNFSWTVPSGETKKLIAKCNFANLDTTVIAAEANDAYTFYLASNADVQAEDESGDSVTINAIDAADGNYNNTAADTVISIVDSGTLTVTLDGSTPNSAIILGNSPGVSVGAWKLTAANESFKVTKLAFNNGGSSDTVAANVKLTCQNQAGTTVSKTSFLAATVVTFNSLDCYVPSASSKTISVMIDTNDVSATGADSGDTLTLTLDASVLEATGLGSGELVGTASIDAAANEMTIRKTKPTLSLASGNPSGAQAPGFSEVFRFNVAASAGDNVSGEVLLNSVAFKLTSTDKFPSGWNSCDTDAATGLTLAKPEYWKFLDFNGDEIAGTWAFYLSDGTVCSALTTDPLGFAVFTPTSSEQIATGSTETYKVELDTTAADTTNGDIIRLEIPNQATATVASLDAINWDDDSEGTGIGGVLVKNLPVVGNSISY